MIYMIVKWNGESWIILHHSHLFDDAMRMYEIMTSRHGKVQLLVDVRVREIHENTIKCKELAERILGAKNKTA